MHTIKTILLAMVLTAVIWGVSHTAGYFRYRTAARNLADAVGRMEQLTDDLQAVGWVGLHPRADAFLQQIISGNGVPLSAAAEQLPVPVSRIRRFSRSRVPVLERRIPLVPGRETVCMSSDGIPQPFLMIYLSPRTEYERLPQKDALSMTMGGQRYAVPAKGLFSRPAWFDRQTGETVYEVVVGKRVRPAGDTLTFTLDASMPPVLLKGITGYGYQDGKKVYHPLMVSRAYRAGEVTFRSGTGISLVPGTTHLVTVRQRAHRIHLLYSGGSPEVTVCSEQGKHRVTLTGIRGCGTADIWGSAGDSLFRAGLTVTGADSVISLLVTVAAGERGTLYGITLEKSSPVGTLLADRTKSVLEVREERVAFLQPVQTAVSRFSWRFTRQGTVIAAADQDGLTADIPAGPDTALRTADGRIVIQSNENGMTVTGAGSLRRITGIRMFITVFINVLALAGLVLRYGRKRA